MRKRVSFTALFLGVLLAGLVATTNLQSVSAQTTTVPDFSQFGYPRVAASVDFTPGTAATLTAGNQKVVIPADFLSKPVKFELLVGDGSTFTPGLTGDAQGSSVVVAFAFRVTDPATNQRVGMFDKPVVWSVTDPAVVAQSAVFNTSAASPAKVTKNPSAGTVSGTTLTHPFTGAGVGWLVLNPAASAAAPVATSAPASLPATGLGGQTSDNSNLLLGLIAALAVISIAGGSLLLLRRTK